MDPTFYRTAADAIAAPPEELAYVVAFDRAGQKNDAMTVIDLNPKSKTYGRVISWTDVPAKGDELHHFGWNACSSAFKHEGHNMDGLQRRYLLVPGLRSSNIYVLDVGPDPRKPKLIKTIDGKTLSKKAGYSRPHTTHCGPDGVFLTCLGGAEGDDDGPGGIALLDHNTFDVLRAWEVDRGPQHFHYDAWWHLNRNVLISSEWGSPSMIEDGIKPELLLGNKYGHCIHFWDLAAGKHRQRIDLGEEQQMALEVRPSHDPEATWGFVGVVISTADLSGSIFRWYLDGTEWKAEKVISIPAEPCADEDKLPPALKPFGAVPPLITDIDLSVDDKFLYVACWGIGEMKQYDVSDPAHPVQVGSVRIGGIAVTGAACISPTRCTAPGTTSSTPTAWARGWSSLMRIPRAVSPSMKAFSRTGTSLGGCACIRFGSREGMRRLTRTVTVDPVLARTEGGSRCLLLQYLIII
jgi:methanethiol oxidase